MRYVHDIFDKMPLNRAGLWQLVMTTHLPAYFFATVNMAAINAGQTAQWTPTGSQSMNGFVPFMIAQPGTQQAANEGIAGITLTASAAGLTYVTCSASIQFNQGVVLQGNNGQVCTMHCTTYQMDETIQTQYMRIPRKLVVYEDFQRAYPTGLQNVASGQTVQVNITPGTAKLRWMLIQPFLPLSPGGNGTAPTVSSLQSALTSAGATATPYYYMDNFQVQVSGTNLYPKNFQYRYDMFRSEIFGIGAPNGNGLEAMRAGLIDENAWDAGYGDIVVNLQRVARLSDDLPKSIDLQFTNMSPNVMSFNVFVFYEKQFFFDCVTGQLLRAGFGADKGATMLTT